MEWFSRGVPLFCPPEGASAGRLRPMSLFNVYTWPIVRLTPRVASRRAAAARQRHLMAWNLTARWAQALHCKCQHMIHKSTDVGCWCSKVKKMRGARSCEGEFTYLISISTFCYDLGTALYLDSNDDRNIVKFAIDWNFLLQTFELVKNGLKGFP